MSSEGVVSLLFYAVCLSAWHVCSQMQVPENTCQKYLSLNALKPLLNDTIRLKLVDNIEDVAECTTELLCLEKARCRLWTNLFNKTTPKTQSEKCRTNRTADVLHLHFRCLLARKACPRSKIQGCDYEHVCPILGYIATPPTPRAPRISAMTPLSTTTTATTTRVSTISAMTPQATTKRASATSTMTLQQSETHQSNQTCPYDKTTKLLLTISWSLTLFLPLMVYLVMRRQRCLYRNQPVHDATMRMSNKCFPTTVVEKQRSPKTLDLSHHDAEDLMSVDLCFHCLMNSENPGNSSTDMPGGNDLEEKGV